MRILKIIIAVTFLCLTPIVFAGYASLEKLCPPASALLHSAIGEPWILTTPYIADGWYVMRDKSVQSHLNSFKGNIAGKVLIYLKEDSFGSVVTCRYQANDTEVTVKSNYYYEKYQNPIPASKFYYNRYRECYECDLSGFDVEGNTYDDPNNCKWLAIDYAHLRD